MMCLFILPTSTPSIDNQQQYQESKEGSNGCFQSDISKIPSYMHVFCFYQGTTSYRTDRQYVTADGCSICNDQGICIIHMCLSMQVHKTSRCGEVVQNNTIMPLASPICQSFTPASLKDDHKIAIAPVSLTTPRASITPKINRII